MADKTLIVDNNKTLRPVCLLLLFQFARKLWFDWLWKSGSALIKMF